MDTIFGNIPEKWLYIKLGDLIEKKVADIQTGPFGTMLHASAYTTIGTPVIAVQNIGKNALIHTNLSRISDSDTLRLSRYKLKSGDIVVGRKGAVDRRALIKESESGWIQGSDCIRIRFDEMAISSKYVSYIMGSSVYINWVNQHAHGATMPSLNQAIVKLIPIPLPPLPTQIAIAHILGTLDDKIELNRRMNETLESIARAIFKSWFIDFDPVRAKAEGKQPEGMDAETAALFPSEFEVVEGQEIPKGWRLCPISDLSTVSSGNRTEKKSDSKISTAQYPVYGGGGVLGYCSNFLYEQPILITGRVGTLGNIYRVYDNCWPSDNSLVIIPLIEDYYEYLYFNLKNIDFDSLNRGSTQPLVTQSDLKKQIVINPLNDILTKFHQIVSVLFKKIQANKNSNLRYESLRDALLPKLLSGELPITNPEQFTGIS